MARGAGKLVLPISNVVPTSELRHWCACEDTDARMLVWISRRLACGPQTGDWMDTMCDQFRVEVCWGERHRSTDNRCVTGYPSLCAEVQARPRVEVDTDGPEGRSKSGAGTTLA